MSVDVTPFFVGVMVVAPPPTVEMMVKPTALVVVTTWPVVRELEVARVLGVEDVIGAAGELVTTAEVDGVLEETRAAFDEVPVDGEFDGGLAAAELVGSGVVCPGVGVPDSDIGGTGVTRVLVCGLAGGGAFGVVVVPLLMSPA